MKEGRRKKEENRNQKAFGDLKKGMYGLLFLPMEKNPVKIEVTCVIYVIYVKELLYKIELFWHKCQLKRGMGAEGKQFYGPSSTYLAIAFLLPI